MPCLDKYSYSCQQPVYRNKFIKATNLASDKYKNKIGIKKDIKLDEKYITLTRL